MFTLPTAVLNKLRDESEQAMQQHIHVYTVTLSRDAYGSETVSSGLLATYPCYIGNLPGKAGYKEEEMVQRLITAGIVKERLAVCILPHDAVVPDEAVCVVSGRNTEWVIIYDNYDVSPNHRIHTRLIIMRRDETTTYKDRIGKNKM